MSLKYFPEHHKDSPDEKGIATKSILGDEMGLGKTIHHKDSPDEKGIATDPAGEDFLQFAPYHKDSPDEKGIATKITPTLPVCNRPSQITKIPLMKKGLRLKAPSAIDAKA